MYCDFFGLRCRPFEDRADAGFFFVTEAIEETLAANEYDVRYGKGLSLLLGEAGNGKSTLMRILLQRLPTTDHAHIVTWPAAGAPDLIRQTCKGFGISSGTVKTQERSLSRLRRHLERARKAGRRSLLVIDQAENMKAQDLEQLSVLIDLDRGSERSLSVMLVAQPRFRKLLKEESFVRLRQYFCGERAVDALTFDQSVKYVEHRLRNAGSGETHLFDIEALEVIHRVTAGTPRLINHICDAALVAAYGAGEHRVTVATAQAVATGDGVSSPPVAVSAEGLASTSSLAGGLVPSQTRGAAAHASTSVPQTAYASTFIEPIQPMEHGGYEPMATDPSPSNHYSDGYLSGGSSEDAEMILRRLEETIARAERVAATTEVSITRFAVVEKHLLSISGKAVRTCHELDGLGRRANLTADEARDRIRHMIEEANHQFEAWQQQVRAASDQQAALQTDLDPLICATEGAEAVEARLTEFAEQVADKVDDLQGRVSILMTGLEAEVKGRERLEDALDRATRTTAALDKQVEAAKTTESEQLDRHKDAEARIKERLHAVTESMIEKGRQAIEADVQGRERLEAVLDRATQTTAALGKQVEAAKTTESELLDGHRDAEARIKERLHAVTESMIEKGRQAIEADVQGREPLEAVLDRATQTTAALGRQVEAAKTTESELLKRRQDAEARVQEHLNGFIENVIEEARQAIEADRKARGRELSTMIDAMETRLERIESRLETSQKSRVEAEQHTAALTSEIERTKGRIGQVTSQVERVSWSLDELSSRAEATLEEIADACTRGDAFKREMHETCGEIASVQRIASSALEEVGGVAERVKAMTSRADELRALIESLSAGHQSAQEVSKKLTETLTPARDLYGALQDVVAHADSKLDQLNSQHAAASSALHALSKSNVEAQTRKLALDEITVRAKEEADRVNRSVEAVWELSVRAESNRKSLDASVVCTEKLLAEASKATKSAEESLERISQPLGDAAADADRLEASFEEGRKLADRVSGISQMLGSINESKMQFEDLLGNASTLLQQLSDSSQSAAEQSTFLQDLAVESRSLIETHQELEVSTEQASRRIAGQLNAMERSIDAGEPLLTKFIKQARETGKQIIQWRRQADEIGKRISEAAVAPVQLVAEVQEHSKHLERVCTAVRKVFSALSKATLDARNHTTMIQKSGDDAASRISTLSEETHRASETLREWVEEAVRVQSRLEKTLKDCPTIGQTHPADSLANLSRAARSTEWLKSLTEGTSGEDEHGKTSLSATPATPKPARGTRATEIARLIEEAKAASEGVAS